MDLSTDQVEMMYYKLDLQTGRWHPGEGLAAAMYVLGDLYERDEDGRCVYVLDSNGKRRPNFVPLDREEIGDTLFAVVMLARRMGVDPESALESTNRKFQDRFRKVEKYSRTASGPPRLLKLRLTTRKVSVTRRSSSSSCV